VAVLPIPLPYLSTCCGLEIGIIFYMFSIFMIVVGLILMWYYIAWEIKLESKGFTFRNFWGKSIEYPYHKCSSVTKSARIDIYYDKRIVIKISALSDNWYELSKKIETNK